MKHLQLNLIIRSAILILALLFPFRLYAEDSVKIKILAVNPSETKKLDASVTHYLPPEIHPEDVLDKAGMEIQYDGDKQTYFLTGKVQLEPKETKTIEIKVRDVWVTPDETLAKIREDLNQNLESLKGTDYEKTAQMIADKVTEKLATIEEEKSKATGMRQRVELYRAHTKQLETIEKQMLSITSLRQLKTHTDTGVRTTKFVVIAENPSAEPKKMTVRALLPKDIQAEDVLDRQGFLVLFAADDARFAVEKEDELQANEKKKYELILRDIWFIPQDKLDFIRKQTETLMGHFTGSNYEAFAKKQVDFIYTTLDEIIALQNEVASSTVLDERIRAFVLNSSRYDLLAQKVRDLQDLLLEVPMKRQESVIEQLRKAVKSLANIIDIIKLGFKPDLSTTWWIILAIIAFLFIMAASFYVIWVSKLKETRLVKKDKDKKDAKSKGGTPAAPPPAAPAPQSTGAK